MKIIVINGPNINMLGIREPEIYGSTSYETLVSLIDGWAKDLGVEVACFQSNCEGEIVTEIQKAYKKYDALVINAAAYTHTSIAIPDAIRAVGIRTVDVHISDINARETFRRFNFIAPVAEKSFVGMGIEGYKKALGYLAEKR